MTSATTGAAVLACAVAAFALDRVLRSTGRRFYLRRMHAGASTSALILSAMAAAKPLIALLRAGVWLGFIWLAGELSPSLRFARTFITVVGRTAITAPVVMANERGYSILDFLELPVAIVVAWLAVRFATRVLASRLERSGRFDAGTRDAVVLLGKCALGLAAVFVVLRAWGVDLSSLTIAASVVGVGLGFGLQNITSNFVSGLLVSIERPIRPGDFVEVGILRGTVQRIGARSTEILTVDRISILVPNSQFLEKEVVNWSHGDPVYALHVPIGVAYGSDVPTVRAALLRAAESHKAILKDPMPTVDFEGFGESALRFDLTVWARDPKQQSALRSDLNYRIEASLRVYGISVPFPQLEVRMLSGHGPQTVGTAIPGQPTVDSAGEQGIRRVVHKDTARNGNDASHAPPAGLPGSEALRGAYDQACDAHAWRDEEIHALARRMRGPDGVALADRRYRLRSYPRCFVGRDAVDWLVQDLAVSRPEALEIGAVLMKRGVFHHVLHEHSLKDGQFFYRFRADEHA